MTEEEKALQEITDRLKALRPAVFMRDFPNMEQADLLRRVQEKKLYRVYGTFGDYCKSLGYSRQHVYDIIRISKNELLRKNYPVIGVAKARSLSRLLEKSELNEQQTLDLIEFARGHSLAELETKVAEVEKISITVQSDLESLLVEEEYLEGKRTKRFTNYYERNSQLRAAAISYHGTKCMGCNFDFREKYGECGAGYIEVHHLRPVSSLEGETQIDPKSEMAVVCSNCHRMIHRKKNEVLSLEELRKIIQE